MLIDKVFAVIGQLGGFVSVHKTTMDAENKIKSLQIDNRYDDSFEIILYNIVSKNKDIHDSTIVYVMLCAKSDLPILVTKDKEDFEEIQTKFMNLCVTYPEPFNYWGHECL
jgi:hypothetical protein